MRLVYLLLFLIVSASAVQVREDNVTVDANSYYHLEFDLNKNATLVLSGEVRGDLRIIVMDEGNYSLWLEEQSFSTYLEKNINSTFSFDLIFDLLLYPMTLHFVFVNTFSSSTALTYSLELLSTSTKDTPIYIFPFLLLLLTPYLRRKK